MQTKNFLMNDMIRDWVSCIMDSNGVNIVPIQVWKPPDMRKYMVNFDGASFGNLGPVAFGCVMCDYQGKIIGVKGGLLG